MLGVMVIQWGGEYFYLYTCAFTFVLAPLDLNLSAQP